MIYWSHLSPAVAEILIIKTKRAIVLKTQKVSKMGLQVTSTRKTNPITTTITTTTATSNFLLSHPLLSSNTHTVTTTMLKNTFTRMSTTTRPRRTNQSKRSLVMAQMILSCPSTINLTPKNPKTMTSLQSVHQASYHNHRSPLRTR